MTAPFGVVASASRALPQMPPCKVCGHPKVPQQRLAIDKDGRLIHAACKS